MSPIDREALRRRLLAEQARLEERYRHLQRGGLDESETDSVGELSSYDNHPADQGSETFEREKDLGLRQDTLFFLGEVKDALGRLDGGRFGVCERCGGPIGEARLAVVPWARRCVDCEDAEGLPGRSRPVEEEVLKPPFGRSRGDRGIPGVDGEDVWQALESYGSSDTPQDAPPARDVRPD